ncbi:hypothetical protein Ngar_c23370 [Candidatus Nitrososphaera gargensis Ga9.2]|uniref:PEFG-CTERM sorting domain-containing protein n=1 Tax=Nitrososphaera gargensis (strain Ga9.2) TaxID=1237085 RepID=K0IJE7_NITGG|nr:hypothetical protein [Candidatus Nitrososphaera gargensis]AFU59263.1 hypothetical protein Ngar_c23370 [Candidatus Nitrososphaera gargensis Ga9.2]
MMANMRILAIAVCALVLVVLAFPPLFTSVYAFDSPEMILKSSFVDSEGRVNVVGTVRNFASTPVQVTVGVETDDGSTLQKQTYGKVIWPLTDSPFKFVLDDGVVNAGEPFIMDVQEAKVSNYDSMLILSYNGMAVGEEKAFVGTVKNIAPFEMYNVSVFAAVHSPDHMSQLDTVRSNIIPVIKPGEQVEFTALPDPAIRSDVLYYSCAGLDYDNPITTIKTGDGGFVAYNLNAVAQVNNLRYENLTDSIAFGVRPYPPNGTTVNLQLPQYSQNQTITVMLDGELHEDASIWGDGKTLYIDFFVPQGDHQVKIQGVRNVPEFPFAMLALAAVTAGAIAAAKFKAAFKIS